MTRLSRKSVPSHERPNRKNIPTCESRAALGYYALYPQEIDRLIEQNESWNEEKMKKRYPFVSSAQ